MDPGNLALVVLAGAASIGFVVYTYVAGARWRREVSNQREERSTSKQGPERELRRLDSEFEQSLGSMASEFEKSRISPESPKEIFAGTRSGAPMYGHTEFVEGLDVLVSELGSSGFRPAPTRRLSPDRLYRLMLVLVEDSPAEKGTGGHFPGHSAREIESIREGVESLKQNDG